MEEHERLITAVVDDLRSYNSLDERIVAPSVRGTRKFTINTNHDVLPRDLAAREAEDVRKYLSNKLVETLIDLEGEELYDAFEHFMKKYRYPILTKAFYADDSDLDRIFFNYRLIFPALGSGNFGEVFAAEDLDGNLCSIKIMHSNIFSNREMIGGFRRGVRSMNILTDNHIEGVVPIIESFEMPPTVVMKNISGNSLEELFPSLPSFPWRTRIQIISDIADIVDRCHKLPEMVLHRDIKPSNIMVEGLDYETFQYDSAVVLDFDMSWHKNSSERDVVFESRDDFGYLAPEQTDPAQRVSPRSAKVDSFGLGMTAFAILGGQHPVPGWSMSEKWSQIVSTAVKKGYNLQWACLPSRMHRAVFDATLNDQRDRLEFSSFRRRLEKIKNVIDDIESIYALDVIAEEIVAVSANGRQYRWDDISDSGEVRFAGGTRLTSKISPEGDGLSLGIHFQDEGARSYRNRNVIVGECRDYLEAISRKCGWSMFRHNINAGVFDCTFNVEVDHTFAAARELQGLIQPAIDKLWRIN